MLVRCVVLKLDVTKGGSLSIKLSINPKLLNKALRPGTLKSGMVSRRAVNHRDRQYPDTVILL